MLLRAKFPFPFLSFPPPKVLANLCGLGLGLDNNTCTTESKAEFFS
jgi:hypothetical protein